MQVVSSRTYNVSSRTYDYTPGSSSAGVLALSVSSRNCKFANLQCKFANFRIVLKCSLRFVLVGVVVWCARAAHFRPPASHFFLRLGLRRMLPQVAPKRFKLILPPYDLRIARANRAVKFSGGCLQNCGLVKLQRAFSNPLSTVGNGPSAGENAPPWRTKNDESALREGNNAARPQNTGGPMRTCVGGGGARPGGAMGVIFGL